MSRNIKQKSSGINMNVLPSLNATREFTVILQRPRLKNFCSIDLKYSFLCYYSELKSRKENFNRIMPDLEIDMHSNPFGDQDDPDKNFDQISVRINQ
jgi:hypothetical protein